MKSKPVKVSLVRSRKKGRNHRLKYPDGEGGYVFISAGTRDDNVAEQKRRELEAKLTLGFVIPRTKPSAKKGVVAWHEFREEYRLQKLALMKSAADVESRLDIAERIIEPQTLECMAARAALMKLQSELFAGSFSRTGRPRSTATVRSHMRSVVAALNWAVEAGHLQEVPKIRIMSMEEEEDMKGRPLVGEEVARMLDAVINVVGAHAEQSWCYLLRGIAASGLRLEELMTITWDQPQTIQPIWRRERLPVLWFPAHAQKNKRTQEIPLCPWFEDLLLETPKEERCGHVFDPKSLNHKFKGRHIPARLTPERVGRVISKIGEQAGIMVDAGNLRTGSPPKYASAHDLRRTFAQSLADSDMPPELVRRLMRHADIRTTERYYQVANVQKDAGKIRDILAKDSPNQAKRTRS